MNTKNLRNASCFLFLVSALAGAPAFADDDADAAATGAARIVSSTENYVGPGGAQSSGGTLPSAAPATRAEVMTKSQCVSPMVWIDSACEDATKKARSAEEVNRKKRGV